MKASKPNGHDWPDNHLRFAALSYLAVAHFGRGRGVFEDGEAPPHWGAAVDAAVATHSRGLSELVAAGVDGSKPEEVAGDAERVTVAVLREVLATLYPEAVLE